MQRSFSPGSVLFEGTDARLHAAMDDEPGRFSHSSHFSEACECVRCDVLAKSDVLGQWPAAVTIVDFQAPWWSRSRAGIETWSAESY